MKKLIWRIRYWFCKYDIFTWLFKKEKEKNNAEN